MASSSPVIGAQGAVATHRYCHAVWPNTTGLCGTARGSAPRVGRQVGTGIRTLFGVNMLAILDRMLDGDSLIAKRRVDNRVDPRRPRFRPLESPARSVKPCNPQRMVGPYETGRVAVGLRCASLHVQRAALDHGGADRDGSIGIIPPADPDNRSGLHFAFVRSQFPDRFNARLAPFVQTYASQLRTSAWFAICEVDSLVI